MQFVVSFTACLVLWLATCVALAAPNESPDQADLSAASAGAPQPALELGAAMHVLHRTLRYRGAAPVAGVRPFEHRLGVAPAIGVDLGLYPFAFWRHRILSHIGLRAAYQQLLATETELFHGTPEARRVDTTMWKLELGLRGRVAIRQHAVGLSVLVARHRFALEDLELSGVKGAVVPSVRYDALKLALDARLRFAAVTIVAELATRFVADTGPLEHDWHKVAHTRVIEAACSLAYRVQRYLDLTAGFSLLRYAIALRADDAQASLRARTAIDLDLSGALGVRFVR